MYAALNASTMTSLPLTELIVWRLRIRSSGSNRTNSTKTRYLYHVCSGLVWEPCSVPPIGGNKVIGVLKKPLCLELVCSPPRKTPSPLLSLEKEIALFLTMVKFFISQSKPERSIDLSKGGISRISLPNGYKHRIPAVLNIDLTVPCDVLELRRKTPSSWISLVKLAL